MNITDDQAEYCDQVHAQLRARGIRIEKDVRNEKLNYKIREAQLMKIPYMLIVGEREKEEKTITVRKKDGQNLPAMTVDAFFDLVIEECGRRVA
jgi:threonyl-tRNA synthetase